MEVGMMIDLLKDNVKQVIYIILRDWNLDLIHHKIYIKHSL